jgi:hypothetical protein
MDNGVGVSIGQAAKMVRDRNYQLPEIGAQR